MQPEQIIGQLLGALVGRKRTRRSGVLGMALGGRSRGGLMAGGTLLTAAGLVWGALESMQKSTVAGGTGSGAAPVPPPVEGAPAAQPGMVGGVPPGAPVLPPPLPGALPVAPPPLPATTAAATALPLVRLAISAARADGALSDDERDFIRARAASLGIVADVEQALHERPSIDSLTGAFESDEQRRAAYAIAWAVMHGDGVVSPGERMYLTQLARSLRLPHDEVDTIERDALGKE